MYEELVAHLRFYEDGTLYYKQAADAIEELSRENKEIMFRANQLEAMNDALIKDDEEQANAIEVLSKMEKTTQWIPVTERLPEKPYGCLVVVWDNPIYGGGDMFLNYYPEFVGWDGEQWNDCDGEKIPLDVAYWMPLPKLPKEEEADQWES